MYSEGERLLFIWRKPFKGKTPGTVTKVDKNDRTKEFTITVAWDDHTVTYTSPNFLNERTIKLNKEKIH